MYCPCCAGRTISSTHHSDESGKFDGENSSLTHERFEIRGTPEPCKPHFPGDLLSVPLPVITDLPAEFIRHSLPDWIYNTRVQRHAIWGYLSLGQICRAYAERLLLENDNKLSYLYVAEEVLGNRRLPNFPTEQAKSCGSSGGMRSGHDRHPHDDRYWQGDNPQQQTRYR